MVLIVVCLGFEFFCCLHLMCVFIFLVRFGYLSDHMLGKKLLLIIIIIIIIIITLFKEDNIFGRYASLTNGPQLTNI